MKKLIVIVTSGVVAAVSAMPVTAVENVFNVNCGSDVMASLNTDGVMTVSGTGSMDTYGLFDDLPDYPWQDDETSKLIENIVVGENITGFDFVLLLPELKTISLPDSFTEFDFWEFAYLKNVQDKVFFSPYVDFIVKDTTLGNMTPEELEEFFDNSKDAFSEYTCIFYGYKDTIWDNLADYGMKFHAMGDLDGDNAVNISDATGILEVYAESAAEFYINPDVDIDAADINRDGRIDIKDATAALEYYAGNAAGLETDWIDILKK